MSENLPDPDTLEIGLGSVSSGSPALVTLNNHGLSNNQRVYLSTTGTLPTGLLENTEYFAVVVSKNTFRLTTERGSSTYVNTSSSGSVTFSRVGYYVRYRIVSEDQGKRSHDSPIYFVDDPYESLVVTSVIDGGTSTITGGA